MQIKSVFIACAILFGAILVVQVGIQTASGQGTYQTWSMVVTSGGTSHSGTLSVLSDGDFTSSGFTGSTDQGSYPISVSGWMSGTDVTFTETASYNNGNGYIYGSGTGTLNADFPYATYGSGTITGTITDYYGERSFSMTWTATLTSGGGGGGGNDYGFGSPSIDPTGLVVAAIAGTLVLLTVVTVVRHNANAKRNRTAQNISGNLNRQEPVMWRQSRPEAPQYGMPNPPPNMQGTQIPPPITMDHGVPIGGAGAGFVPPELGGLPFLNATWLPGQGTLTWGTPQFDQSKYALLGYNIYQQTYGPQSTAAQSLFVGNAPPNATSANVRFDQTFRWNTAGDVAGYRVDPVFGQLNSQGQVISQFQHGGLGIRIGEPFGTFGVGP